MLYTILDTVQQACTIYRDCFHCQPHSRDSEELRDLSKDTQREEQNQAPLCARKMPIHQETLLFADPTSLKQCVLNHVSNFQKATPVISDSLPSPPLAQPPVLQETQCNPSMPVAVTSIIHLPPQWALRNTPQVEVIELCQNENHLGRGKGGRKRKGKEREKKKVFL